MTTNNLSPLLSDAAWNQRLSIAQSFSIDTQGAKAQIATALTLFANNLRGFSSNLFHRIKPLNAPENYTTAFALNAILDQIGLDFGLANWVAAQRSGKVTSSMMGQLEALDQAARKMVNEAVDYGLFASNYQAALTASNPIEPRPFPITYVLRSPNTRVIPYCPIALIGLPLYALGGPDDTLAKAYIAREIGRLAFWKGTWRDGVLGWHGNTKIVHRLNVHLRVKGFSQAIIDGASTIFADVFACLLMREHGLALTLVQAATRSSDRFYAEDPRYELPPELCTETYLRVLELLHDDSVGAWKATLAAMPQALPQPASAASGYPNPAAQALKSEVRSAAEAIFEFLQANKPHHVIDHQALENQYQANAIAWGQWGAANTWSNTPEWENWFNELKSDERGRLADAHRLNTLKQNYHVNDGDFAPIYWKKLLYARGWVLESPENGGGMP